MSQIFDTDYKVLNMKVSIILGILLILCIAVILIAQKVEKRGKGSNKTDISGSLGRYFIHVNCKDCKIESVLVVKGSENNKTSGESRNEPKAFGQEETGGNYEHFYDFNVSNEYGKYGYKDYYLNGSKKPTDSERKEPGNEPTKSPFPKETDRVDDYSDEDYDGCFNEDYANENDDGIKSHLPTMSKSSEKSKICPTPQGFERKKQTKPDEGYTIIVEDYDDNQGQGYENYGPVEGAYDYKDYLPGKEKWPGPAIPPY